MDVALRERGQAVSQDKISDKLKRLAAREPPNTQVPLHAMLRAGMEDDAIEAARAKIASCANGLAAPEILKPMGIVLLESSLASVAEIARIPEVVWLDTASEAPLEELLDD